MLDSIIKAIDLITESVAATDNTDSSADLYAVEKLLRLKYEIVTSDAYRTPTPHNPKEL